MNSKKTEMRYIRNKGAFIFIVAACICIAAACTKEKSTVPLGDKGETIVKLFNALPEFGMAAGYGSVNIDLVPTPQTFAAAELRRDVASNAELNKSITVFVKNDPGIVSQYDPALSPLPNGAFTVDASTPLVGNDYHITMNPGEFAKVITITIKNILTLDLSKSYAMGFTISSIEEGNGKVAVYEKSIVFQIGVKNRLDGIYRLKGYIFRAADPTSTGWVGPKEVSLVTTGINSVRMLQTHGWANTATIGIANTIGFPTYNFDEANNITVTSDGGPFPDGLKNLSGYNSRYDPETKTIYAYATWGGGETQRRMEDTLTYLRPR